MYYITGAEADTVGTVYVMTDSIGYFQRTTGPVQSAYSWDDTSTPDVTYAIIGNGFDLACGLPTSYKDFLEFVSKGKYDTLPSATSTNPFDWRTLHEYNFWFRRFESVQIGSKWVDFEDEISRVVTTIERRMGSQVFMDDPLSESATCAGHNVFNEILGSIRVTKSSIQTYRDLVTRLQDDLIALTRGLEAYLHDYLGVKDPEESEVAKCHEDRETVKGLVNHLSTRSNVYVISFNYTRTLEDMLENRGVNAEFCYVHGTAGDGGGKNHMVLGINEPHESLGFDVPVEFGPFMKYNQRIYKQADSSYVNWLNEAQLPYERFRQIKQTENEIVMSESRAIDIQRTLNRCAALENECRKEMRNREVIIFGHSLGVTDKDILRSFITLPDTRTVVYRHKEEVFSKQVSNITAILGKDEVIVRTGGRRRTLEFRDQVEMQPARA